jgi:hypothetical protein
MVPPPGPAGIISIDGAVATITFNTWNPYHNTGCQYALPGEPQEAPAVDILCNRPYTITYNIPAGAWAADFDFGCFPGYDSQGNPGQWASVVLTEA